MWSLGVFIFGIIIFRLISTGTPSELKNYIIKSDGIEKAYKASGNDFTIYKIDVRSPFTFGDAIYAESVLYLENAENMQFIIRCKNEAVNKLLDYYDNSDSKLPFKFYLKVSDTSTGTDAESENDGDSDWDYIILEPQGLVTFGKDTGRYKYFMTSFDGVKIDYANTKVELYMLMNSVRGEIIFSEEEAFARFTIFDINMPKSKVAAKKFKLSN